MHTLEKAVNMSKPLAARVNRVQLSPTVAMTARAIALQSAGQDVISLSAGEPDFRTPKHIGEAAWAAIQAGKTKYTAIDGTKSLKDAIILKFQRDNGLTFKNTEILVSNGGKQSLYNACQALVDAEHEVIIPAPFWASFPDMVKLADAKPVIVQTDLKSGFRITPKQLNNSITSKTRAIIINSPCNPSGTAYTRSDWEALAKVLVKYPKIYIIADDIYEHIYWGEEKYCTLLTVCPELRDRTIVVNGVSKSYAMTGWRIGYSAAPEPIIKAMTIIQSQSTTNACSISQAAAEAALRGPQTAVKEMCKAFKERHDYVVDRLNGLNGFKCRPCEGTFYAFPNIEETLSLLGFKNDAEFCEKLLEKQGVAIVPGTAFGSPGHIRLSFAASLTTLKTALDRIEDFIS
jgi:aspartate aminotransferase